MQTPAAPPADTLPSGTLLAEFEIERVLGVGGFGVVYLARDRTLQRRVALKEFMPGSVAVRQGTQVMCRSQAHADTFATALRSFVNEARLLARFDHPALVQVHRFWEDHGTAYTVMPYYEGSTLRTVRQAMEGAPSEAWLRALVGPLLGALDALHREQVFHRDVAPDNILVQPDGAPVLLDFGAARESLADRSQSLTAILKPSFAPIEQYAESTQLRQGAWTDLYALAAVLYFCITGRPPLPAAARVLHDEQQPLLAQRASLRSASGEPYSEALLATIDTALCVHPRKRPQDVAAFRALLDGQRPIQAEAIDDDEDRELAQRFADGGGTRHTTPDLDAVALATTVVEPREGARRSRLPRVVAGMAVVGGLALVMGLGWGMKHRVEQALAANAATPVQTAAAASAPRATDTMASTSQPTVSASAPVVALAAPRASTATQPPAHPSSQGSRPRPARSNAPPAAEAQPAQVAALNAPHGSAHEICDGRPFFKRLLCMKRQCMRAEFENLPECANYVKPREPQPSLN
ncbi:MAG TPA: serine/threonine-protein kinase [Burkholderiaceae bacterium]|nr:serine/threonine-protein kinase [Burkholderiaceae bacterium]